MDERGGLRHALTSGRRPEFILLLDADFIVSGKILKRTLGLFEEDDVGIVQTPQHFFNQDPVQRNLVCASAWPDEQRFFFNTPRPCTQVIHRALSQFGGEDQRHQGLSGAGQDPHGVVQPCRPW
jgi:hypothetical protein